MGIYPCFAAKVVVLITGIYFGLRSFAISSGNKVEIKTAPVEVANV